MGGRAMSLFSKFKNKFTSLEISETEDNGLRVNSLHFKQFIFENQITLEQNLSRKYSGLADGLLFEKLPADTRRWLEQNKISYMTETGYAAIYLDSQTILIKPRLKPLSKQKRFQPSSKSPNEISPSRIINPRGMAILDAIIRLPIDDLRDLSAFAFTKRYSLAQPTLSKIMNSIGARNLLDLRKIVGRLDKKWWLKALEGPRTGRGMTPFYKQSQSYRLHDKDLNQKQLANWYKEVLEAYQTTAFPGPLEVAKSIGAIADKTVSFWVDSKVLPALKREYRLVPTRSGEEVHCEIAIPKNNFQKESIISAAVNIDVRGLPAECLSLNLIRVLWDLTHADSRSRESRQAILEILLDEI